MKLAHELIMMIFQNMLNFKTKCNLLELNKSIAKYIGKYSYVDFKIIAFLILIML